PVIAEPTRVRASDLPGGGFVACGGSRARAPGGVNRSGTLARMATDSHLRFALAVHTALGAAGGNSCFSPYSVASALTLAARAARGRTREELVALLGDPDEQTTVLRDAAQLIEEGRVEAAVPRGEHHRRAVPRAVRHPRRPDDVAQRARRLRARRRLAGRAARRRRRPAGRGAAARRRPRRGRSVPGPGGIDQPAR